MISAMRIIWQWKNNESTHFDPQHPAIRHFQSQSLTCPISLFSLPSDSLLSLNHQFDRSPPSASPPHQLCEYTTRYPMRGRVRERAHRRGEGEKEEARQELIVSPSTVLCSLQNPLLNVQLYIQNSVETWCWTIISDVPYLLFFTSFNFTLIRPFLSYSHLRLFSRSHNYFFPFRSF